MSRRLFTLRVGDTKTKPVWLDPESLRFENPREDAAQIAGTMGLVGALLGEYEERLGSAEAKYNHWKAKKIVVFRGMSPRPAEWLSKVMVQAEADYQAHRLTISQLRGDVTYLQKFFEACRSGAFMLRALMQREEAQGEGESLPVDGQENTRAPTRPMAGYKRQRNGRPTGQSPIKTTIG